MEIKPTPRGEAIKMADALKGKYQFVKPLFGGPVFDFPAYGLKGIDLSNLTEQMAERLINKGYKGIERINVKTERAPLDGITTAKS